MEPHLSLFLLQNKKGITLMRSYCKQQKTRLSLGKLSSLLNPMDQLINCCFLLLFFFFVCILNTGEQYYFSYRLTGEAARIILSNSRPLAELCIFCFLKWSVPRLSQCWLTDFPHTGYMRRQKCSSLVPANSHARFSLMSRYPGEAFTFSLVQQSNYPFKLPFTSSNDCFLLNL